MLTTKTRKTLLLAATGMAAAMICSPALAQDAAPATATTTTAAPVEDADTVVIVRGMRKSLKTAVDRKRKSAQIVDSIDAEDVGKLPDNNVAEAISRVTGVQITRERGEGGSVAIRGQTDISTTINGQEANTGVGRSAGLNDIPAELLKSVQVYKTRTADQVEGGIAGTVNVDLRRPLDLPKGWTVAGSARTVLADVGDTNSPYFSGLVANRWDTPMGEMGFLLNLSYQKNEYNEQYAESETIGVLPSIKNGNGPMVNIGTTANPNFVMTDGPQYASLPQSLKDLNGGLGPMMPYKARYGVERGYVERPALNAAFQWRVNDELTLLAEGTIFNASEHRQMDVLDAQIRETNSTLSNIVMMPDGNTMRSATFTAAPGATLPVGVWGNDSINETRNTHLNFEAHWHKDAWDVNASIATDENTFHNNWFRQVIRFAGQTGLTVDMDSDKTEGGAPYISYDGVDFNDVATYKMAGIETGKGHEDSKQSTYQLDATYRVSEDKFFRSIQFGVRHSSRDVSNAYGYRYANWNGTSVAMLTDFPTSDALDRVEIKVPGLDDAPSWYRLNLDNVLSNMDDIRAFAKTANDRGGSNGSPNLWDTPEVETENGFSSFSGNEKNSAIYAQFSYGFKAFNFPVDGVIGVRQTHTSGISTSKGIAHPTPDANGELPLGMTCPEGSVVNDRDCTRVTPGQYDDILPSVNAVIHLRSNLQFRLAYTENVDRPDFGLATSWVSLDQGCKCGWGGNTELVPNHEKSYDASLEYYFGRGGVVSFAAYLKKPDGFIIWVHEENKVVPGYPGTYAVDHPMNAGPGTFQGYEFNAQGFFDFLPGKWANFGGQFNYTYNQVGKIKYCYDYPLCVADGDFNATGNSKFTYNLALYYDTPQLSARIAYNYRDRYRDGINNERNQYSLYVEPTSRLDASLSYTPIKQLTLSVEATNLLHDNTKRWWGEQRLIPMGIRVQARTIQMSARFRY